MLKFFLSLAIAAVALITPGHAQTVRLCNQGSTPLEFVATFRQGDTFHRTSFATIESAECLSQRGRPPMDFVFFVRNEDGDLVNLDFLISGAANGLTDYEQICVDPEGTPARLPLAFARSRWQTDQCAEGEYAAERSFTVLAFQDTRVVTVNLNAGVDFSGRPTWPPAAATSSARAGDATVSDDPMQLLFPERTGQSYTVDRVSFTIEPGSFRFSPHSTPVVSGVSSGEALSPQDLARIYVWFFDFALRRAEVQRLHAISPLVTLAFDDAREVLMYLDVRQRQFYMLELDAGVFRLTEDSLSVSPELVEFAASSRFTHSAEIFGYAFDITDMLDPESQTFNLEETRRAMQANIDFLEHWISENER